MRVPGRLHVTWQDDTTLRVDTDAGMQTRIFSFAAAPPQADAAKLAGSVRGTVGIPGCPPPG